MNAMDTTARIGAAITDWLSRGGPEAQFLDWLRGYDLPVAGDEEPYVWLVRGLEARGDLGARGGAFCERVRAVLVARPDQNDIGRWRERVLYNLYMLCACLHCPTCLAEPLLAIYRDRPDDRPMHGLDPRAALRTALVENQVDTTLHEDWKALLEGRSGYLPGDPEAGFEGVLKMHPCQERLDEPVERAVLDAFEVMIGHLRREPDRIDRLSDLIAWAGETYPSVSWDLLLSDRLRCEWEGKKPVEKWVANVLNDTLCAYESVEAQRAGRKGPRGAQDVPDVRSRTESKRRLNEVVGACTRK